MQIESPVRAHKTAREKAALVAAYDRTELTQAEFVVQHQIGLSTLQRWLRQRANGSAPRPAPLLEVPNFLGARPSARTYRLCFPRGLVLEVPPGFQVQEVRCLAQLLQGL
jgi:hypothetical protein